MLWEGRPDVVRFAASPFHIALLLIFGLVPLPPVAFVTPPSTGMPSPLVFLLPLALVWVLMFGPLIVGLWLEGSRTSDVVTDRRILVRGWRRRAELDLARLEYLDLSRSIFGTWTISFSLRSPALMLGFGAWLPALHAIDDGERVYEIISNARARLRP